MPEKTELAPREEPAEQPLVPVATTEALVEAMRRYEALKAALLEVGRDTYEVAGQTRIRKSGWRKLALAFGLSDELIDLQAKVDEKDPTHLVAVAHVRVSARGGRTVDGIGVASSRERAFAHVEHDLPALAHTRAKNRAIADMLGSSDLVAEELEEPEPAQAPAPAARASQSEGFRGPPPVRADGGQHAVVREFLHEVLGDDLAPLVRLEERDGALYVVLPRAHVDAHGNAFLSRMLKWGYGVHESSAGLAARLEAPHG